MLADIGVKLFNSKEVCDLLNISSRTLQRLVSAGKIEYLKDGKTSPRKFKLEHINNYINDYLL